MNINAFTRIFQDAEDLDLTIDGVTECAGYDDQYYVLGFRQGCHGAWFVRRGPTDDCSHYVWEQITRNSPHLTRENAAKVCTYLAQ